MSLKNVRVIPVLTIKAGKLVKTCRFRNPKYIGDPINAVKIFSDLGVDELIILDIGKTSDCQPPDLKHLQKIADQAFMPLAYGGGIKTCEEAKEVLQIGFEKVVINNSNLINKSLVTDLSTRFGSQAVVVSIDIKRSLTGKYKVYAKHSNKHMGLNPTMILKQAENDGAGEILLNSVDRDGTWKGYDIELINEMSNNIHIPFIICGGAKNIEDFHCAMIAGASAVAAGSFFFFREPNGSVMISYSK